MILRKHPGSDIFSMSKAETLTNRNGWTGLIRIGFILNIRHGDLRGLFRAVYISDIRCGCLRGRYCNRIYFWHPLRILPRSYLNIDIIWKSVTDASAEASGKWHIFNIRGGNFGQPERMPPRTDLNRVYFKHPAWVPPWNIPSSVYFGHTMRMPPRKVP